ncbi:MAG: hypothetical protein JWL82_348 [Parcubacteria group bacterium]|nr:hypothetical protein [Parcubacteria group bacterium]
MPRVDSKFASMAKHLYFVRHGESTSNKERVFIGSGATLTEEGKRQAELVAERFTRIPIDALVSSSFIRARETAEPIAKITGLPIEESDLLIERRLPSIQRGKSHDDPEAKNLITLLINNFGTEGFRHSDEENFDDIKKRALAAISFLENHPAERLCVVSHGIFLRALFCGFVFGPTFTGHDFRQAFRAMSTSNTGISYITIGDYGWTVSSWNDSNHLG